MVSISPLLLALISLFFVSLGELNFSRVLIRPLHFQRDALQLRQQRLCAAGRRHLHKMNALSDINRLCDITFKSLPRPPEMSAEFIARWINEHNVSDACSFGSSFSTRFSCVPLLCSLSPSFNAILGSERCSKEISIRHNT